MLEEVMQAPPTSIFHARGVTLIELIVVIAIVTVLTMVALPSFSDLLAKKRVEGALTELTANLNFARSEAVVRNTNVSVTFGSGCYVIHTTGSTATSCAQSGVPTLGTGALQIKLVQLDPASTVSFSPNDSMTSLTFDSLRAMATSNGTDTTSGSVNINSSVGSWQLRVSVMRMGRTQACSPNRTFTGHGYSSTC